MPLTEEQLKALEAVNLPAELKRGAVYLIHVPIPKTVSQEEIAKAAQSIQGVMQRAGCQALLFCGDCPVIYEIWPNKT